jgi:hypothetical protein
VTISRAKKKTEKKPAWLALELPLCPSLFSLFLYFFAALVVVCEVPAWQELRVFW